MEEARIKKVEIGGQGRGRKGRSGQVSVPGRSVGRNIFGLSAQMWMKKEEVIAIIRANSYDYDEPAQHFEWALTDDVCLSDGP